MTFQGFAGIIVFIFIAWTLSENRKSFRVKTVVTGLLIQFLLAIILLKFHFFSAVFLSLNKVVLLLDDSTKAGTSFVFGYLGGGNLPFSENFPQASFILAFRALPIVLFISALSSLLFYWNVLPVIVNFFSKILQKFMKIGGAEGFGVSANIFVGMVESPLLIRPYLNKMTRSEIFTLMTCGMATIAGTVMVLYATILDKIIPNIMGHILTASIISIPASIIISKIIIPETDKPTSGSISINNSAINSMDAITKGTIAGVQLLINITAMIIVLIALVHFVNTLLGFIPQYNGSPFKLERILGVLMSPIVWLMGIPWSEALTAGSLMGTKTILNELIAYIKMSQLSYEELSQRSMIIMTYAMCGFANPGSLGIMIGGMGTIAPDRRDEIIKLGFRSIISGTLSTCMTGAIVGIINI